MSQPAVEVKVLDVRPGKPPLRFLDVDVHLRNDESSPRWFLLPTSLASKPSGGVYVAEVGVMEGHGRAVVGRFLGTRSFYALLLPPSAQVRLSPLTVEVWDAESTSQALEVNIASDVLLGKESARAWFAADPTSDLSVDAGKWRNLSVHRMPDRQEVPVTLVDGRSLTMQLAVPR